MSMDEIKSYITPFLILDQGETSSFFLNVGEYKVDLFRKREDEGFLGNGDDWVSLALVFLNEKFSKYSDDIKFDPEADMFVAYSTNKEALKEFAVGFKDACENDELISDLFSRAELD